MKNLFVFAFVLIVFAGCGPTGSYPNAEIPAISDTWEKSLNDGDIDSLVALYTEDARLLPPNAPLGEGHDAVRADFGAMIDAGLGVELDTIEAVSAGDIGFRVGNYTLNAGDVAVDHGKYIETWRKVDGNWKIANDIWNSDQPAASGGSVLSITHDVEDGARWLAAWQGPDSRAELFKQNGVTGVRIFQNQESPNSVGVVVEVNDMDTFMAWLQSEDVAKLKVEDGVIDSTMNFLVEVK